MIGHLRWPFCRATCRSGSTSTCNVTRSLLRNRQAAWLAVAAFPSRPMLLAHEPFVSKHSCVPSPVSQNAPASVSPDQHRFQNWHSGVNTKTLNLCRDQCPWERWLKTQPDVHPLLYTGESLIGRSLVPSPVPWPKWSAGACPAREHLVE